MQDDISTCLQCKILRDFVVYVWFTAG